MIAWKRPCRFPLRWTTQDCSLIRNRCWSSSITLPRIVDILEKPIALDTATNAAISVNGFVRSVRKQKRVAFAAIGDGSSLDSLQLVLSPQQAENLSTGTAVTVTGKWTASPAGKQQANELHASKVVIQGANDATTYPIQKKFQTAEFLRSLPHLRPRLPYNSLLLRLRSQAIADVTRFFSERGFVQTHTPIITSSDCEGAGEVFEIGSDPMKGAESPTKDVAEPFFRQKKYLTVSSQLHLEALAQAIGNVWTLSPTFRAEKSDTARHLSEFYMLEAEMAFVADSHQVMDLVEDMIRYISSNLQQSKIGQELLNARDLAHDVEDSRQRPMVSASLASRWTGLNSNPWPRITYHEACLHLQDAESQGRVTFDEPPSAETGLQTEHERYLAGELGQDGPVFVTDYPKSAKPFYMAPSDGSKQGLGPVPTVACFDLLMPEVCEVVGGSMREHRLEQLQAAMVLKGVGQVAADGSVNSSETSGLDWYLDLRRYGSVPHGGFGLGFDRLLGYLSGVSNIRDMVTFPRHHNKCLC